MVLCIVGRRERTACEGGASVGLVVGGVHGVGGVRGKEVRGPCCANSAHMALNLLHSTPAAQKGAEGVFAHQRAEAAGAGDVVGRIVEFASDDKDLRVRKPNHR